MFRTVPLSIINDICHTGFVDNFRAGSEWMSSIPILLLLESCLQTCMAYTIAECTVNNSWWSTEDLSETCTVSFPKQIWEISASSWFYYKETLSSVNHLPADGNCRSKHVGNRIFIKLLSFCCAVAGINIVKRETISDTCKGANCVAVRNVFITGSLSHKSLIHNSSWIQHINWGLKRSTPPEGIPTLT
jgi:hypothetical protein